MNELELYMNFYNLCDELYEISPWQFLDEKKLLSYVDKKSNSLYYAVVIGHEAKVEGVIIINQNDINSYNYYINNIMPNLMLLNYQSGLFISYLNKEQVSPSDNVIPKKLNITFKDKWISVKMYEKGYLPYVPSYEQFENYLEILKNFIVMLKHFKDDELPKLTNDAMASRFFEKEQNRYHTVIIPKMLPSDRFYTFNLNKKDAKELKRLEHNNLNIEIEFNNYLPIMINDNYVNDKYLLDYFYIICDHDNNKVIDYEIVERNRFETKEEMIMYSLNKLIEYFKKNGIVNSIYVRDNEMKELLGVLEKNKLTKIIVSSKLSSIDSFIDMIVRKK